MPLELSQFDVMEHLWKTLEKTPDGLHLRYLMEDVEQLWFMGFVDTECVEMAKWKEVFEPYRQSDGSFFLNHDEFVSLDRYRYKGEIRIPFNAMLINEGKYTSEGLDDLINASIVPSCRLSKEDLNKFFNEIKKEFRQADGLILIKSPAKRKIAALIDANPSPLRNLEILLDNMFSESGAEMDAAITEAQTNAATAEAAIQASRFSSKPTTLSEAKALGLKDIEKSKKLSDVLHEDGKDSKVELKKIKRSRKGMRG